MFHASFRIQPSGSIEIADRQPVQVPAGVTATVRFDSSVAMPVPPQPVPQVPAEAPTPWPIEPIVDGDWADLQESAVAAVKAAYDKEQQQLRVPVRLHGATAKVVEDRFGEAWGEQVQLGLAGFAYDQIDRTVPEESWRFGHGSRLRRRQRRGPARGAAV